MAPSRSCTLAEVTSARRRSPWVSTRRCRFLPLISLPASKPCGSMQTPLFGAFHALAVDHASRRLLPPLRLLATQDVEAVVDPIQRAVPLPQTEIAVQGTARRQILRHAAPLAAGGQDVHQAVHDLAFVHRPFASAPLARRDQRLHQRPFLVREVARITQMIAIVAWAILLGPHRPTLPSVAASESR